MQPTKLVSILLALSATPAFADFLTNGNFETGATSGVLSPTLAGPPLNYQIYVFGVGGQTDIGGWTVSNSTIDNGSATPLSVLVTANPPQPPGGGLYALDFDPFWNIATGDLLSSATGTLPEISQTVNLPAGDYILSFDAAIEIGAAPESRSVEFQLTGAASLTGTATTSRPDDTGYDHFSYLFSSTGGATTLTFIPDDFSPQPNFMLDNVSIVATPEPARSLVLLAAVLVLTGLSRYLTHARWAGKTRSPS